MRIRTTLGTLTGAFLLLVAVPTSAHASTANGQIEYIDAQGNTQQILNPTTGVCETFAPGPATKFINYTPNNLALVYTDSDCADNQTTVSSQGGTVTGGPWYSYYVS